MAHFELPLSEAEYEYRNQVESKVSAFDFKSLTSKMVDDAISNSKSRLSTLESVKSQVVAKVNDFSKQLQETSSAIDECDKELKKLYELKNQHLNVKRETFPLDDEQGLIPSDKLDVTVNESDFNITLAIVEGIYKLSEEQKSKIDNAVKARKKDLESKYPNRQPHNYPSPPHLPSYTPQRKTIVTPVVGSERAYNNFIALLSKESEMLFCHIHNRNQTWFREFKREAIYLYDANSLENIESIRDYLDF